MPAHSAGRRVQRASATRKSRVRPAGSASIDANKLRLATTIRPFWTRVAATSAMPPARARVWLLSRISNG
ncbi:MAG: hypothetical protein DMD58_09685 [Gemmatimonadetes bacterium]|nr:MAG: hypothetical protein DMD58_09685 [Gemmatimonadota bacterium]